MYFWMRWFKCLCYKGKSEHKREHTAILTRRIQLLTAKTRASGEKNEQNRYLFEEKERMMENGQNSMFRVDASGLNKKRWNERRKTRKNRFGLTTSHVTQYTSRGRPNFPCLFVFLEKLPTMLCLED